jgi:hypothetical protein
MTTFAMDRGFATLTILLTFSCASAPKPIADPATTDNTHSASGADAKSGTSSDTDNGNSTNSSEYAVNKQEDSSSLPSVETTDKTSIAEGLQLLDRRSLTLDFALNLMKKGEGKGVQSGNWSFAEERTLRVKSAKNDVISEMQVVYGKWEAKPLLGLTYEMPTDGKTYLLSNKNGNVGIVRGANEKLSVDEQNSVKSEYGWVGSRSPLRQALLDVKLQPGAELPKNAQIARIILGQIPGCDTEKYDVTAVVDKLESGTRKKVLLKVSAKSRVVSNKTSFDLDMTGTAAVDVVTGWVLAADLSGTTTAKGSVKHAKQGELEVSGKGKVSLSRSSEFR